jgi:hypothetical protein
LAGSCIILNLIHFKGKYKAERERRKNNAVNAAFSEPGKSRQQRLCYRMHKYYQNNTMGRSHRQKNYKDTKP